MTEARAVALRLPSLDRVLSHVAFDTLKTQHGHAAVVEALRGVFDALRPAMLDKTLSAELIEPTALAQRVQAALKQRSQSRLRCVINLTGTVLHTNLGRALLPPSVVQAVAQAAACPVNLEYDLDEGGRGDRDDLIASLICQLTGAEAATVVNNNAAAVLLALSTLAGVDAPQGKVGGQVIVSRGELVEIGGAFRIPDIMRRAGCELLEVGTTNRTHARDYSAALGDRTAALLKVHTSNYAIEGFSASATEAEVARIAHAHGVPMMVDLGSGTLVDMRRWGLPAEPTVRQSIEAGADVVTFSGDKLLGGPQAGLIVGKRQWIERIQRNPLKRALRVGKLTLAALEATLRLYLHPERLTQELTTLALFTRSPSEMAEQAARLQGAWAAALGSRWSVRAQAMHSQIGSGALPVESLPSFGLVIEPSADASPAPSVQALAAALRQWPTPVIGRIRHGALWLDLRCLRAQDEATLLAQLPALAAGAA